MNESVHASLDRPMAAPLEGGLPSNAIPYGKHTPWEVVILKAHNHPGKWFELRTRYASTSAPVQSARAAAAKLLSAEDAAAIEFAYIEDDGKFTVYFRLMVPASRQVKAGSGHDK